MLVQWLERVPARSAEKLESIKLGHFPGSLTGVTMFGADNSTLAGVAIFMYRPFGLRLDHITQR